MSIQSEITRLTTAKSSIKTAIESKGVSVPADTALGDYATLINNIQTGGGISVPNPIEAGDTPVMADHNVGMASGKTDTDLGLTLTIPTAGTYRFRVPCAASGNGGIMYLYKNGIEAASGDVLAVEKVSGVFSADIQCAAGDIITVVANAGSGFRTVTAMGLTACINWNNGF